MRRLTVGATPLAVLTVLFAIGTLYAQQPAEHRGANATATAEVLEVFCNHPGTGQLCPGSNATAKLFNLKFERIAVRNIDQKSLTGRTFLHRNSI